MPMGKDAVRGKQVQYSCMPKMPQAMEVKVPATPFTLVGQKLGCVKSASSFYSTTTLRVFTVGHWPGQT